MTGMGPSSTARETCAHGPCQTAARYVWCAPLAGRVGVRAYGLEQLTLLLSTRRRDAPRDGGIERRFRCRRAGHRCPPRPPPERHGPPPADSRTISSAGGAANWAAASRVLTSTT